MNKHNALIASLLTLAALAGPTNGLAKGAQDWQRNMLLNPSDQQIKMENRGRVLIYDGLTERDIAMAMDTQFDRVGSMMFVRTQVESDEGGWEVFDDGCD